MTVTAGEIWLADRGGEARRLVFVISDSRFHRYAERAVVAPVLDEVPAVPRPWHIVLAQGRAVAINQLGAMPLDRMLERIETADFETLSRARRAVRSITG